MAALQCEICGGKLIGKLDGTFECESCGTAFEKERVVKMMHEVNGTIKVENTLRLEQNVNIGGTVKIEGGASASNFVKRGMLLLGDRKWGEADAAFELALNLDAECAEAYLGKYLAQKKKMSRRALEYNYERDFYNPDGPLNRNQIRHIRKFASGELAQWIKEQDKKLETEKATYQKEAEEGAMAVVPARKLNEKARKLIAVGHHHIVGVKSDGTVLAVGSNDYGQCNVEDWTDITAVAACADRTIGLKVDGTVVAAGRNEYGECDVEDWTDIVAIAAGFAHTAGLKRDGTVVAVGRNEDDCCVLDSWSHITDIACGDRHTAGLKENGSVVVQGDKLGKLNIDNEIFAYISAKDRTTYGVPRNGVVGTTLTGIVDMLYGDLILQHDGKVSLNYRNAQWDTLHKAFYNWDNIVAIFGLNYREFIYIGLKSDGTVLSVGDMDNYGDPRGWRLFNDIATFDEECKTERPLARKRLRQKRNAERRTTLREEQIRVSTELKCLRGLFAGKRRRELEAQLAEIERELKELS